MRATLSGRRILIPRGGTWGDLVVQLCSKRGAVGVPAPLIETRPPRDVPALESHLAALSAGRYSWVFITSAASVEVLRARRAVVPASTSIAAVGPATARALDDAGFRVSFCPAGSASASALVEQWKRATPRSPSSVLVMRSDLAPAVISDALEAAGHSVGVCIAYRTTGIDLPRETIDDLIAGRFDAVLVTSHSVAAELGSQLRGTRPLTVLACLGLGPAREVDRLGFGPRVVAAEQTMESLLDALGDYFESDRRILK